MQPVILVVIPTQHSAEYVLPGSGVEPTASVAAQMLGAAKTGLTEHDQAELVRVAQELVRLFAPRTDRAATPLRTSPSKVMDAPVRQRVRMRMSDRQHEILRLLVNGMTAREVGASLSLSSRTVEYHKYRLMRILSASTTAELVHAAFVNGLVSAT
jgi:DNA-binding CsgD family transcriptional regulator